MGWKAGAQAKKVFNSSDTTCTLGVADLDLWLDHEMWLLYWTDMYRLYRMPAMFSQILAPLNLNNRPKKLHKLNQIEWFSP